MTEINLYYTTECARHRDAVAGRLGQVYGLTVRDAGVLSVYAPALMSHRRQHDAYILLTHLLDRVRPAGSLALWMVDGDISCDDTNYVFGLAMFHGGAVVSTSRLDTVEMVVKEAVHEAGHVMGLVHCRGRCVMRFSNTLDDALRKPDVVCDACRTALVETKEKKKRLINRAR